MFRGFFGRFVRHLPQGLHKRQRHERHACSFAAKQQRFDHQHNNFSPHSRRAGDLNRSGSSGVLPSLPPRAKKVAPQSEIPFGPMVDTSTFCGFSLALEKSLGPEAETALCLPCAEM